MPPPSPINQSNKTDFSKWIARFPRFRFNQCRTLVAQISNFHARLEEPMLLNCPGHNTFNHMNICNAVSMQFYSAIYLFICRGKKAKWENSDARLNYWLMVMSVFVCIKLDLRYKMSTMRYEVIIFGLRVSASVCARMPDPDYAVVCHSKTPKQQQQQHCCKQPLSFLFTLD